MNGRQIVYGVNYRGNYQPFYIPRGRPYENIPGLPENKAGFQPIHYVFSTVGGVSIRVLEPDPLLKFLQIQNKSTTDDIIFAFGANASASGAGVALAPAQVEIFDVAVPTESLNIFCAAGAQIVQILAGH